MIDNKKIEEDMFNSLFSFMTMGGMTANKDVLIQACYDMRKMMTQKTAGQRQDKPTDMSWGNFERVKNTIVIEAMCLVFSGELGTGEVIENGVAKIPD